MVSAAVAYLSSDRDAKETQRCVEAEGGRCLLLKGDVKDDAWCRDAVRRRTPRRDSLHG